jgi:predicted lipoprotein with Yx(FWY)xxD motif
MKRLLTPAFAVVTLLGLAACGSDGSAASTGNSIPSSPGAASAVSVGNVDGIGKVLVDSAGMTLYTPDQEANGSIVCSGDCVEYWKPVMASPATPAAPAGGPALSVVTRPDGSKQVAAGGHPLYTFTADSAGKASGDGASDAFDGHSFTWHAVKSDGSLSTMMPSTPTTEPGRGSGGGYGY